MIHYGIGLLCIAIIAAVLVWAVAPLILPAPWAPSL
jgi:hypothetical protein